MTRAWTCGTCVVKVVSDVKTTLIKPAFLICVSLFWKLNPLNVFSAYFHVFLCFIIGYRSQPISLTMIPRSELKRSIWTVILMIDETLIQSNDMTHTVYMIRSLIYIYSIYDKVFDIHIQYIWYKVFDIHIQYIWYEVSDIHKRYIW